MNLTVRYCQSLWDNLIVLMLVINHIVKTTLLLLVLLCDLLQQSELSALAGARTTYYKSIAYKVSRDENERLILARLHFYIFG